jgi:hypothetical protein
MCLPRRLNTSMTVHQEKAAIGHIEQVGRISTMIPVTNVRDNLRRNWLTAILVLGASRTFPPWGVTRGGQPTGLYNELAVNRTQKMCASELLYV